MQYRVKNKRTGKEEVIRHARYAAYGPAVYEKLETLDDSGDSLPNPSKPQAQRYAEVAAPVVKLRPPQDEPEEVQEPAIEEQPQEQIETTAPKKRGRKPKSISSSNADEK